MSRERDLERPSEGDHADDAPASEALPLTTLTRAATRSLDRERDDAEVSMTRSAVESGGEVGDEVFAEAGRFEEAGLIEETRLFEPGEQVDHFEVVELLGEGGMGAVYLAVDTKLGRRVALKVVQRSHLGSAKAVESFLYEARTTARFNHPHIVTVYAVGEHRGSPYVALEYLEGKTLQEILREGRLTLEPALRIGLAVAEALVEAHAHDVLHRDLKPANIVIPKDGRVRVLDFGLAKRLEGDAPPSMRMVGFGPREYTWAGAGTPAYMAPEQWRAEETTVATDVWAMGVLLFELCAGRRPIDEPSLIDQERVVCGEDDAPRLERFGPVPRELADLVARCLSKDPSDRPAVSTLVSEMRHMLGEPERLHFDGTRSTLRPPDSPVVSISGDANPIAPTLLLDSDGAPQADVGTSETMLDPGSEPGLASHHTASRDATTGEASRRSEGAPLRTRTSPSSPPASAIRRARRAGSMRTALVGIVALLVGGAAVWLLVPRAPVAPRPDESPAAAEATSPEVPAEPVAEPPSPTVTADVDDVDQPPPAASASGPPEPPVVAAPVVRAAPPKPPEPVLPPFDEGQAQAMLKRKAKSAEFACRFHDGARVFAVEVTFGADGRARRVRHNLGHAAGGQSGRCVIGVLHGASVAPFRGEQQTRTVGVALRPKL